MICWPENIRWLHPKHRYPVCAPSIPNAESFVVRFLPHPEIKTALGTIYTAELLQQEREPSMRIEITLTDDSVMVFEETSRSGGSYCTSGKSEMGWYIVTDAYGNQTSIPAERIKHVKTSSNRSW